MDLDDHMDLGFTGGSAVKQSTCNAGDAGAILGSGRSPGEGNGNLLQYIVTCWGPALVDPG